MRQTKHWLVMAMTLLCCMTRAEVTLSEYISHDFTENSSKNEDGTWQYEYTSEILSCDASFETIVLTFLASNGDSDKSGYPWVGLAEFYLYDGEGNEIALTAENFDTNAQEPTEGPLENICDGDRTTFFHSMWSVGASDYHKLIITLPEDLELKDFRFKYITRWTGKGYPLVIKITADNGNVIIPRGSCGENVTYTLSHDGHLNISGNGAMADDYYFTHIGLITSATIQEGITSIGSSAFSDCSNLTSVTIPESVTSIGNSAFRGCTNLTTITIPEDSKLTSIEGYAFSDCSNLTAITIPASVAMIGTGLFNYPFFDCSSLTSIIVAEENPKYDSRNGCNAIIETESNCLILGCSTTVIPKSVRSIGEYAFYSNDNLTSITIPEGVTSIKFDAFYKCSNLTSITIPQSVTEINEYAFNSCSALTSINVAEKNPKYDSRNGCNAIIETASNRLISGCSTTVIPNSVTSIGYAFYECSSLTSIHIPESVTEIAGYAFYGCSSLTSITCESATPPTISNTTFENVDKSISLYVPQESIATYQAADGWKEFTNIVSIVTAIDDMVSTKGSSPITYDLSGRRVENNVKGGIYIRNGKKFVVK